MGSALKNLHSSQEIPTALGGENLFVFLFVSRRTRLQGDFWLLGFLRNPFHRMDLGIPAYHTLFACS